MAVAKERTYRGVERHQEIEPSRRRDDVRTAWQRMSDRLDTPTGALFSYLGLAAMVWTLGVLLPGAGEMALVLALCIYGAKYSFGKRSWEAPYRVPAHLLRTARIKFLDGSTGRIGDALIHHGREINTGRQLWSSANDVRTHRAVVGTTGSGKTEELLGFIFNLLLIDSGAMLVDGKSDPKTVDSLMAVCRPMGRDEDVMLQNYIMGGRDFASGLDSRRSHTYNPLSSGSAAMKSELMVSLLDTGQGGGADMWQGRAINFMEAITPPLSFLADKGMVLFNPRLLCDFYLITNIENLLWFGIFIDLNGKIINLKEGPDDYKRIYNDLYEKYAGNLRLYMENLPGYAIPKGPHRPTHMEAGDWEAVMDKALPTDDDAKDGDDAGKKRSAQSAEKAREKVLEQHGYITMQLVRATGNLTFNYGHIYNDEIGEINFRDVLLNRRILLVMLPALERSKASMEQLGKMAVASIKGVLATLLDTPLEGSRREIVEGRPSNAPVPYGIICDEYGYYVVPGFAVAPAQARSYGVSMTFGVQDYSSLVKGNKEEGEATWENTNLRHCGRVTGGEESETYKKISGAAGQALVSVAQGMDYNRTSVDRFRVSDTTTLEKVSRVNSDDLGQQQDGEFHLIVGTKTGEGTTGGRKTGGARVVRYMAFYTGNIPPIERMRLVHYVQVKKFSDAERDDIARNEAVAQRLASSTSAEVQAAVEPFLRDAIREARLAAGQALTPADACEDLIDKFLFYARAMKWQVSTAQLRRWLDSYDDEARKQLEERSAQRAAEAGAGAVTRAAESVVRNAAADSRLAKRHMDLVASIVAAWKSANVEGAGEGGVARRTAVVARGKTGKARAVLVE